ncbi:DUF7738 domain-containing protein [Tenacibaculum maritimum]|uniref:DUF7738 domain-containing protein n=1 Tax=Tenacibaculum maritimum TaxID=107401 RepID=UPI0012E54BDB|nr:hypothetical protein [Tenacibaculum maritimum]CAA0191275.1 Probable lipoprotein precursor [Tenacibaculum maritimum]
MKQYTYLIAILFLTSCKTSIKKETKDTNSPAYKAFMAQKHRFELNGCELTYNGKPFRLGMSLKEFEKVFGDYNTKGFGNFFVKFIDSPITASKDSVDIINALGISFKKGVNYMIVNHTILSKEEKFEDFIGKTSKFEFDDFLISSDGYKYEQPNCNYKYFFRSPVIFNRIGGGHMALTGKPKLDKTSPVRKITINYYQ